MLEKSDGRFAAMKCERSEIANLRIAQVCFDSLEK